MAGNTAPSPWLDKEAALEAVLRLVAASAAVEHGELAYVDAGGRPRWLRPPDGVALTRVLEPRRARQPGALGDAVSSLVRSTTILPPGSFVFVASDFLTDVPSRIWPGLRALGLDVIPVVIQDPTWEQTFPPVGGVVVPVADAVSGRTHDLLLTSREARERARANEGRLSSLITRFRRLGFDPVVVGSSDPEEIRKRVSRLGGAAPARAAARRMRAAVAIAFVMALVGAAAAHGSPKAAVTATVDRSSVGLGDVFHYTVEARIDTTSPVTVDAGLGAFTAAAAPRVSRSRDGDTAVIRIEQDALCLDRTCAPGAKPRDVRLPRARARWASGSAVGAAAHVTLVPRVPASAVAAAKAHYKADISAPARPRLGATAALLIAAAVVLALAALVTAVVAFRPSRRAALAGRRRLSFDEAARLLLESAGARPGRPPPRS